MAGKCWGKARSWKGGELASRQEAGKWLTHPTDAYWAPTIHQALSRHWGYHVKNPCPRGAYILVGETDDKCKKLAKQVLHKKVTNAKKQRKMRKVIFFLVWSWKASLRRYLREDLKSWTSTCGRFLKEDHWCEWERPVHVLGAVEKQKGSKDDWNSDRGKMIWDMRLERSGELQLVGFWQFYWVKRKTEVRFWAEDWFDLTSTPSLLCIDRRKRKGWDVENI